MRQPWSTVRDASAFPGKEQQCDFVQELRNWYEHRKFQNSSSTLPYRYMLRARHSPASTNSPHTTYIYSKTQQLNCSRDQIACWSGDCKQCSSNLQLGCRFVRGPRSPSDALVDHYVGTYGDAHNHPIMAPARHSSGVMFGYSSSPERPCSLGRCSNLLNKVGSCAVQLPNHILYQLHV